MGARRPCDWGGGGLDPYKDVITATLDAHPPLRATRLYDMLRSRGYAGSVIPLRPVEARGVGGHRLVDLPESPPQTEVDRLAVRDEGVPRAPR